MPKKKERKLPHAIVNYLRVLVHRIKTGQYYLPVSIYINKSLNRITTRNLQGTKLVTTIESLDYADFEMLYFEIVKKISDIKSMEKADALLSSRL